MLRVEKINSFYGKIHVIKDISLKVEVTEIVTIIGANGCGKSTLLKTICGLIPPRDGAIFLEGENITKCPVEKIILRGLCLIPERRELFTDMSVRENLEIGAYYRYKRGERSEILKDIDALINMFPPLGQRMEQKAGTLSGGEQQMLALARGMISKPKLLLLDEPSLGLAPVIVKAIFDVIIDLRKKGMAILLVEQNSNIALAVADRGYVMQTGSIAVEDSSDNLLKNKQILNLYLGKKSFGGTKKWNPPPDQDFSKCDNGSSRKANGKRRT